MEDAPPPPAVTVLNEGGASPYVLLCEHASNRIPAAYAGLGLPPRDLRRHIAWDIGAADVSRGLSRRLDAPLFLSGYSRLLIDCNRPPGAPTSIPARSEDTDIPGNLDLDAAERARRERAYFAPFHASVARSLDRRAAERRRATVVGVHSFTPVFMGVPRPWLAGVLYAGAERFGRALVERLAAELGPAAVGDNEPYRIEPEEHDHTVPVHGDARPGRRAAGGAPGPDRRRGGGLRRGRRGSPRPSPTSRPGAPRVADPPSRRGRRALDIVMMPPRKHPRLRSGSGLPGRHDVCSMPSE